jgi:ATP-dependent helicase/nuclease subunit B
MLTSTLLNISIRNGPSQGAFGPGEAVWNEHRGGPDSLLRWLETQLGLLSQTAPLSSRILEFAGLLDGRKEARYAESLTTDRWGTASDLLARRDELRMAGWSGLDRPELPPLVRDLALATRGHQLTWPDTSSRLIAVSEALETISEPMTVQFRTW